MFRIFCKHQWKLLDKEVIPAPAVQLQLESFEGSKVPYWMFSTKVVQICTCEKCGKIQKFETDSQ